MRKNGSVYAWIQECLCVKVGVFMREYFYLSTDLSTLFDMRQTAH